jgi:hypothetical protein
MIGLGSAPRSSIPKLLVGQTKIDFRAAQAFLADLYANAELELPEQFDPVEEIIRVVNTLREQGKNENIS